MRKQYSYKDLPGGPLVKNMPPSVGDPDSIPHLGTKVVHAVATKSTCQQSQKKKKVASNSDSKLDALGYTLRFQIYHFFVWISKGFGFTFNKL